MARRNTNTITRIGLLVGIQITLVVASFAVLAYYESQLTLMGNSINIAGKNRFLTSTVILQAEKQITENLDKSILEEAVRTLDFNIDTLRSGGALGEQELRPLQSEFLPGWQLVDQSRNELKDVINNEIADLPLTPIASATAIAKIEAAGNKLVSRSDNLVIDLSNSARVKSESLILLQISLLVINVTVHLLMLYLITRLIRPMIAITDATNEVKRGNLNVKIRRGAGKDEVSYLADSFNEMIDRLKQNDRLQSEFINAAAHELRTPVQPLLGLADILSVDSKNSERSEIGKAELELLIRNVARLERVSSELLEASTIDAGKLVLYKVPFELNEVILAAIAESRRNLLPNNQIDISFEQSIQPITVNADPRQIQEVILILINNAMQFAADSNVMIIVEEKDNCAKVRVIDTLSRDPDMVSNLFTRFAANSGSGSGLGLYIAKKIIEAHNGRIWAEKNNQDKGATFTFTIPTDSTR